MSSIKLSILLFSGLFTRFFTLSEPKCQPYWSQYGSRCFKIFTTVATWHDAELNCVKMGGHLASVHNTKEYAFIQALVLSATGSNASTWLGATDEVQERVWVWTDKSPFDFTYWYTGEPNDSRHIANYLQMNFEGHWNDEVKTYLSVSACVKATLPVKTKKVMQLRIISKKDLLKSDIEDLVQQVKQRLIDTGMPSYNTLRLIKFYKNV